jgi:hypothetical protein
MKRNTLVRVEAVEFPRLRLVFADGFSGEFDMSGFLARGHAFTPLKDEQFFRTVAIGEFGLSFGWNLDKDGEEIDFGAEAARADIERTLVKAAGERFAKHKAVAAE